MLDHGIILEGGGCRLRPMTDTDTGDVLQLWNQDFVVGKLYMSKTSVEIYNKHFELYKVDPNQYRWVVEDLDGNFVGTSGLSIVEPGVAEIGFFALYPTEAFQPVVPGILVREFSFSSKGLKLKKIVFTINSTNKTIRKMHRLFKDVDTGRRSEKVGSDGNPLTLEHWEITPESWASARPMMRKLFFNQPNRKDQNGH